MSRADRRQPWVETRPGALFFVNAVLLAPELVVLVPLALRATLRASGLLSGPSPYLDTFPLLASYVLPYAGWLLVVPLWTTVKNLRMELPGPARLALWGFVVVHGGFLAYTVWHWIGP